MSLADNLKTFCNKLGFDNTAVKNAETPTLFFARNDNVSAKLLKNLTTTDVQNFVEDFKQSLNFSIAYPVGFPVLLKIENGTFGSDVNAAISSISAVPDTTELSVEVKIDKTKLLENLASGVEAEFTLYYFFRDNVLKLLNAPLLDADELLFTGKAKPRMIIVSEICPQFEGSLLNIVSETQLAAFDLSRLTLQAPKIEQLQRFYGDEYTKRSWIGFDLKNLTPVHFLGKWSGDDATQEFARAAAVKLQNLTVIYTANRCSQTPDPVGFQAMFANSERAVFLELQNTAVLENNEIFAALTNWISSGKDALTVFQTVVARILHDDSPEKNYQSFATSLPTLYRDAEWNYKLFIDGKIDKHFEDVQKFSGSIAEIAKKISEGIDTVTKSVTEALLAAIGLLIVTILTALVKNEATTIIFQITFVAYGIYLFTIATYRMGSIWCGYQTLIQDAEESKAVYKLKLGDEKIAVAAKPIERRKTQFQRWFRGTIIFYLLLIIAVLLAAFNLPSQLEKSGLIKVQPSPTPTQPPAPPIVAPTNKE